VAIFVSVFEVCFYYWVLLSLIRTIQQLTLRRQALKLNMYKYFLGILIVAGIIAGILLLYYVFLKFELLKSPWQNNWIALSFWDALYLFVMTGTAFLFRPRENNLRYGYAEFFTEDDDDIDDENEIPLDTIKVNGTETKHRKNIVEKKKKKKDYDSSREQNIQKTKPKFTELEQEILNFEIASDSEDMTVENEIKKME